MASPVISAVGRTAGKLTEDIISKTWFNPWLRSSEEVLSRTPEGATFARFLKEHYEPNVAKAAEEGRTKLGLNPREAMNYARRVNRAVHFGPNDSVLSAVVNNARKYYGQGHANEVADALSMYLHETPEAQLAGKVIPKQGGPGAVVRKQNWRDMGGVSSISPYSQVQNWENKLRHKMGYAFTTLIVIPHLSQPLNTILLDGFKNVAKATIELASNPQAARAWATKTGALEAEIRYAFERKAAGQDTWVQKLFHHPGFDWVRQWQITLSAIAGKHAVTDAAEEFAKTKSGSAETLLNYFGQDTKKILTNHASGKPLLDTQDILHAAYRSADESMFIRSGMRTPYKWDLTPLTRTAFMYKHYMFSEMKFISDAVKLNFKRSPVQGLKTLAILGTAFPLVGELVKTLERGIRGQGFTAQDWQKNNSLNPKTLEDAGVPHGAAEITSEYIDAMEHTAGLGVYLSMFRAAKRGALHSAIEGPVISTAEDVMQDIVGRHWKHLGKIVVSKAGPMGPWLSNQLLSVSPEEKRLHNKQNAIKTKQSRAYNKQHENESVTDALEGK